MNKIGVILQREYVTRVAKRSFLIMTIMIPLLIFGFYAAIIAVAVSGSSEKQNVAVIDKDSLFNGKIDSTSNFTFTLIANESIDDFLQKYHQQGYGSVLYIPAFDLDNP